MHKVHISGSGETIALPHNAHLSDAAELQVSGLVFGCRAGACGICVIEVLDGLQNLSEAEEGETWFLESLGHPEPGKRLACQCRLRGDVTIRQA